jgi:hypothetical protein
MECASPETVVNSLDLSLCSHRAIVRANFKYRIESLLLLIPCKMRRHGSQKNCPKWAIGCSAALTGLHLTTGMPKTARGGSVER